MQKKRPQAPLAPETYPAQDGATVPVVQGRAKRVRNRLVIGVAVAGLAVTGAGTPGALHSLDELRESQKLLTLAELNRQAVTLAHSLSDERDEVTAYIAAGRDEQRGGKKERRDITDARTARVDRQIEEIRGAIPDDRAELRRELATVPTLRRDALTGKGSATEAHRAYTTVIGALQGLADELADRIPPRAEGATRDARATAELGLAVEQASAARGLLLAALSVPAAEPVRSIDPLTGLPVEEESEEGKRAKEARGALSAAAQQARVRELAALADFDQAAAKDARDSLAATVTGAEVKTAESYLTRLTDQPGLSDGDLRVDTEKLETALTARIEQMRGVESALASERIAALKKLRDDDVTALEIQAVILGGLVLICLGVSAGVARSLTRPLAVLRIGAARVAAAPEREQPIGFTGRNDEFAQVVHSLNALHGRVRDLSRRADELSSERTGLIGSRDNLAAKLSESRAELRQRTDELTAELQRLRHTVDHTFVNLSLRTLGLVERQLGVIEKLEEREQDPERLATLFKLDHMATVMRRHSENLLVLAGAEHGHGHPGPVPLVDVLRAAVSEIERYERVVIQSLPPHAHIAGFAADDLSHLIAELLENATAFSPPDAQVELSGWLLENGEVMLSVTDTGIGMTASRLAELNSRLDDPQAYELAPTGGDAEGLGLRVAGLLASRHRVRVQLREQKQGGVTAVVVLPAALLPAPPPADGPLPSMSDTASTQVRLPGSVAEANSNALPSGPRRRDRPSSPRRHRRHHTYRRRPPRRRTGPPRATRPRPGPSGRASPYGPPRPRRRRGPSPRRGASPTRACPSARPRSSHPPPRPASGPAASTPKPCAAGWAVSSRPRTAAARRPRRRSRARHPENRGTQSRRHAVDCDRYVRPEQGGPQSALVAEQPGGGGARPAFGRRRLVRRTAPALVRPGPQRRPGGG